MLKYILPCHPWSRFTLSRNCMMSHQEITIVFLLGTGKTLMARQIGKMLNTREPKIISGPGIMITDYIFTFYQHSIALVQCI